MKRMTWQNIFFQLVLAFAFIHGNSVAHEIVVKAVPIDCLDSSLAQKGLLEFAQKLSDLDKAEAQIGIHIQSALNSGLT